VIRTSGTLVYYIDRNYARLFKTWNKLQSSSSSSLVVKMINIIDDAHKTGLN